MERLMRRLNGSLSRSVRRSVQDIFQQSPLDLRFALQKTLDPRVTFTRASDGTYVGSDGVLKMATTNEPRFDHNPTTGESLGLLVEEQRTNQFAWSNSATNNETWNNVGTLLSLASGQADPAGGTAGIRAADVDNVNAGTFLQRTSLANLTAGTTVTYSIWLRPISCPTGSIILNVFANTTTDVINATFAVSGTTITSVTTSTSGTGTATAASFDLFPGGWYRCRLAGIPSTVTMADVRARVSLGSYQRVLGTARFDWYGAQLESGAFATSYIPTTGATATRSADVASITGTNFSSWYSQSEGTVFASSSSYGATNSNRRIAFATDGTTANRFGLLYNSSNNPQIVVSSASAIVANPSVALAGANYSIAAAYKLDDYAISAAGFASSTDTSGALPIGINQLSIGSQLNGEPVNGTIKRLCFWPQRLANSTLQTLTQ